MDDTNTLSVAFKNFTNSLGNYLDEHRLLQESLHPHASLSRIGPAIEAFQTQGAKFGVPAEIVSLDCRRSYFYGESTNLFLICANLGSYSKEKTQACLSMGINPWFGVTRDYTTVVVLAPKDMANRILGGAEDGGCSTRGSASILTSTALDKASAFGTQHASAFASALFECFEAIAAQSMQGACGVMGSADKRAKFAAETILDHADKITIAAGQALSSKNAQTISMAKDILDAKSKADAFNPAKYKKNLAVHKKERLISIMKLAERSGTDPGSAAILTAETPWISDEPHALCIPIKNHAAVLSSAIFHADISMIELAERVGANIWLLSAQEGKSNACDMLINLYPGILNANPSAAIILSRMLALGAHWDGTVSPVEHALSQLQSAKADPGYYVKKEAIEQARAALKSGLESLCFEQLLKIREADALEVEQQPALRRRSAL